MKQKANNRLTAIKNIIHPAIDEILSLDIQKQTPEIYAKQIALQTYVVNLQLSAKMLEKYFSEEDAQIYLLKYQKFCMEYEIYLEELMTQVLTGDIKNNESSRFIRSYYSFIYQVMAKNEIHLSAINANSKVCMIGAGSMPLSILFTHKFSGAHITGIDKITSFAHAGKNFINFMTESKPDLYTKSQMEVLTGDGETFNYQNYDAIILSIHISNKDSVINRILATKSNNKSLTIIDRQTKGLSEYFYKSHPIQHSTALRKTGEVCSGIITSSAFQLETSAIKTPT